jgi:glycine hydroxymethyltransferase
MVPFDERSPFITSGIRIGTPAITTRGMSQDDMVKIVALIDSIIEKPDDEDNIVRVKAEVKDLCTSFPLYSDLRA